LILAPFPSDFPNTTLQPIIVRVTASLNVKCMYWSMMLFPRDPTL
jgi:hypothetical protein